MKKKLYTTIKSIFGAPKRVYLDYASGAPLAMEVVRELHRVGPIVGNPSSIAKEGVSLRVELETARATVAKHLGARAKEIVFTSGGTEANNLAIQGVVFAAFGRGDQTRPHIITTNIEHASVLETCKTLERIGHADVTYVPVETNGIVDVKKIKEALRPETVLVSVMMANNEIGTIQPIREIAKTIRHFKKETGSAYPYFHTDACQAFGYLPMRADELGADLITLNGSKLSGPRGVGALYVKDGVKISPILFGGDQEKGRRAGTENVTAIVGFAKAVEVAASLRTTEAERLSALRDFTIAEIEKIIPDAILNGDTTNRLPNNINMTIPNISSELLVIGVDALGFAISEKSACKSGGPARSASHSVSTRDAGKEGMSHVIAAIREAPGGIASWEGSIRITLGRATTKKDLIDFVEALKMVYDRQMLIK